MKIKKVIYMGVILLIIISGVVYAINSENTNIKGSNNITKKIENNKKVYKHTFPKRISGSDFFKGEFISNNVASIYPRRDALVKDILVDIGDKVKEGDTLAILFAPGVELEANSKINIKSTLVNTKNNLLLAITEVKKAKLSEIDTKINEKEIVLNETVKNFDSKIKKLKSFIKNKTVSEEYSVENINVQITVEEKSLEILVQNLETAISSQDEKLNDSKNNIKQKEDLLDTKINEVLYNIVPIFYIGNEQDIDYVDINSQDLSDIFGAKNSSIKNELLTKTRNFQNTKDTLSVIQKYEDLIIINNLLIETLKNTIVSVTVTESTISSYITSINSYNTGLITSRENHDDALNSYNILIKTQDEKIEGLKKNIDKQKEVINLKNSSYNVVNSLKDEKIEDLELELEKLNSDKSLLIQKLRAELETIKQSKKLLEANENKNITSIKNEIAVAKSNLNNEYIASGDYKIISPFSGIISKRNINIGEKISKNIEVFRLTQVENSLSKVTKKEIKFYVPEILKDNLIMNKEVIFTLGNNKNKSFTGIIYRIAPEIDEDNFSITVQAKVEDDIKLPNKSTIRVNLETKEDVFKIPTTSIYNKEERKIVYYKKDNGKLGIRDINIISDDGEYSLVSGKFDDTLKVVTTPIFIK